MRYQATYGTPLFGRESLIKDSTAYINGEVIKQSGVHAFRHSLRGWPMARGENPQIARAMLR